MPHRRPRGQVMAVVKSALAELKRQWLLVCVVLFSLCFLSCFVGTMTLKATPLSVVVGTVVTTVGSVTLAVIPAYVMAGVLSGVLPFSGRLKRLVSYSVYLLAGMPSIVYGIIGFVLFADYLGFGWSILSATLTLALMLVPILIAGFVQILGPLHQQFDSLNRSLGISPLAFLVFHVPKLCGTSIAAVLQMSWSRAVADTAAVMLTCGVVTEMPSSVYDSVRVLSYHIYLLAMDEPGGMPEARTLSVVLIVVLVGVSLITQRLGKVLLGGAEWVA